MIKNQFLMHPIATISQIFNVSQLDISMPGQKRKPMNIYQARWAYWMLLKKLGYSTSEIVYSTGTNRGTMRNAFYLFDSYLEQDEDFADKWRRVLQIIDEKTAQRSVATAAP